MRELGLEGPSTYCTFVQRSARGTCLRKILVAYLFTANKCTCPRLAQVQMRFVRMCNGDASSRKGFAAERQAMRAGVPGSLQALQFAGL